MERSHSARDRSDAAMTVRVLVVDDFALIRSGIAAALEVDPEIEVVGFGADGAEAFELARELAPDVIVLDLRMSEHGGMETLELCAEHLPATKALILTANENPSNLEAAMAAGAAGFLTKGVEASELRDAVIAVHRGETVLAPALAARIAGRDRPGPARGDQPEAGADPARAADPAPAEPWIDRQGDRRRAVRRGSDRPVRSRECPEEDRPVEPIGACPLGGHPLARLTRSRSLTTSRRLGPADGHHGPDRR
jgi:DNA-binding NarL/FixJ family response regulator